MERAAKLRRVNVLRSSLPHMSQAALVAFLAKAQDEDLPAVRYTRDVREARNAVALQDTPYGNLIVQADLELRNGRTVSLDVSNPQALLYVSASRKMLCACLRTSLAARHGLGGYAYTATRPSLGTS